MSQIKDLGQHNLAVIASSAADEYSLVREENDMSVMTYFVVEELKDHSGISHVELYESIKPKVEQYAKEKRNIDQTPLLQDDFDAPLILNP